MKVWSISTSMAFGSRLGLGGGVLGKVMANQPLGGLARPLLGDQPCWTLRGRVNGICVLWAGQGLPLIVVSLSVASAWSTALTLPGLTVT